MDEGGFDDFEMKDLGKKYPQYDEMNYDQLANEYNNLQDLLINDKFVKKNQKKSREYEKKFHYLSNLLYEMEQETSLTENDDGKTVTITNKKSGVQLKTPGVESVRVNNNYDDVEQDNFHLGFKQQEEIEARLKDLNKFNREIAENQIKRTKTINRKIKKLYKKTLGEDIISKEIVDRSYVNDKGAILFKQKGKDGILLEPKLIIKVDRKYSTAQRSKEAIMHFKELVDKIPDAKNKQKTQQTTIEDIQEEPTVDENLLVKTNTRYTDIDGLTKNENRELEGALNPENSIDPQSRIEDNGALQIQADHFQETMNKTIEMRDQTDNPEEFIELEERVIGLREARDKTLEQRKLEETRMEQENDISRLQKFKEWAKENLVGVSALAISIAGIITTIIVGARKAISQGAKATGKFAKAVYNLGKKLGAILAPILNIIAQALSWGAKGLAWLSKNQWLLALAVTWFIYDQYKERRKRK